MTANRLRRFINFWPPIFFAGIRANRISADFHFIEVQLTLRWYNKNLVGTQFGGSMFAMTDPWYMIMLYHVLGKDYYVWDQKASIEFLSPGKSRLFARFQLTEDIINQIKADAATGEKVLPEFVVEVVDAEGKLIAKVHRTLYVRKKPSSR